MAGWQPPTELAAHREASGFDIVTLHDRVRLAEDIAILNLVGEGLPLG